ncbi:MAG: mannitol dehydrogenase family protein [Christensenellales bacterium]|jgi:fructuronate reductase
MFLNKASLRDSAPWRAGGFALPAFDWEMGAENTLSAPKWIHFGAGNLFRAFPAAAMQRVLDKGLSDGGIVACECFDGDIIDRAYRPFDNLSVAVTLKSDGTVEKTVIASVPLALRCDGANAADEALLKNLFASETLQMVSFTITEKGYALSSVKPDIESTPDAPISIMGKVASLLKARFEENAAPLALVSMDNCSRNGEKLRNAVLAIMEAWTEKGCISRECLDYVKDESCVSFPWTMIDKITPRPDAKVAEMLRESGFQDTEIIVTEKHTHTAAFVNAEEAEYLVIEDNFPNGRPPLEAAGIYFTDRDTVNKVEKMKVCTCLNPLHTALAVLGCIMGYPTIAAEMRDPLLSEFVKRIAYREGMPVVTDPGILSPEAFAREVIEIRLSNPFMPDTPQRIATDTSQKLSVRFGETVKAYMGSDNLDVRSLRCIPFVYAAWIRYLTGIGDDLIPFAVSPDPLLPQLKDAIDCLAVGEKPEGEALDALLAREDIFGVSLERAGMKDAVLSHLTDMLRGKGAVRESLKKLLEEG